MNNSNLSEKNSLNDSTISYSYIIPNNKILIQKNVNTFENPRIDEKTDFPMKKIFLKIILIKFIIFEEKRK